MISRALDDESLPVYGKGENIRDWLFVKDHCKAIDLVMRKGRVGEVYNIGGHNEKTNLEVVKIILKELGKPESLITYVTDRPGHDMRYAIDPTKIHSELGWLPETKFEDGIKRQFSGILIIKVGGRILFLVNTKIILIRCTRKRKNINESFGYRRKGSVGI